MGGLMDGIWLQPDAIRIWGHVPRCQGPFVIRVYS